MLLRMRDVEKSFPGVRALQGIDLDLAQGEVLALLGENGAGKSTLIKILGGAHLPDRGTVEIQERRVTVASPIVAQRSGIGIIYQEFNLVPSLSARDNLFLGQEKRPWSVVRLRREHQQAKAVFERIGVTIDPELPCQRLSVAQQQVVEIAKALLLDAQIIVMDEPSAALTLSEVERLHAIIRELKSQGIGVIYISHRLDEIFDIADRVMVLRDGRLVGNQPIDRLTRNKMIEMMVGRKLEEEFPKRSGQVGDRRLVVRNLTRGRAVQDVSFTVRSGEVLGLTGLVGAGRTETARLIFGADRREQGLIQLDGRTLQIRHPRDAIAAGICLLPENRQWQGLVLKQTVQENFGLPNLEAFTTYGVLSGRREAAAFAEFIRALQIKLAAPSQSARTLSGGNQQKVVLAKWLQRNAEVIIFDEPTRGIDVGAKLEIYLLMNRLAAAGKAILMISSELPEVLGMSDRILVMHGGRIAHEIKDIARTTQEDIMTHAVGASEI